MSNIAYLLVVLIFVIFILSYSLHYSSDFTNSTICTNITDNHVIAAPNNKPGTIFWDYSTLHNSGYTGDNAQYDSDANLVLVLEKRVVNGLNKGIAMSYFDCSGHGNSLFSTSSRFITGFSIDSPQYILFGDGVVSVDKSANFHILNGSDHFKFLMIAKDSRFGISCDKDWYNDKLVQLDQNYIPKSSVSLNKIVNMRPVIYDRKCIYVTDKYELNCLDMKSGEKWSVSDLGIINSTPIYIPSKKAICCTTDDGHVVLINNQGKTSNEVQLNDRIAAGAILYNNRIYIATFSGLIYCLSDDLDTIWDNGTGDMLANPVSADNAGNIYAAGRSLTCVSSAGDIMWSTELLDQTAICPAIVTNESVIVVVTVEGDVIGIAS